MSFKTAGANHSFSFKWQKKTIAIFATWRYNMACSCKTLLQTKAKTNMSTKSATSTCNQATYQSLWKCIQELGIMCLGKIHAKNCGWRHKYVTQVFNRAMQVWRRKDSLACQWISTSRISSFPSKQGPKKLHRVYGRMQSLGFRVQSFRHSFIIQDIAFSKKMFALDLGFPKRQAQKKNQTPKKKRNEDTKKQSKKRKSNYQEKSNTPKW